MRVFKKGNKWWIDYNVNGQRIRKPISERKSDAEKVLALKKVEIMKNRHGIPRETKIKFKEFAPIYLEKHAIPKKKSFRSDISIINRLIPFFGNLYLEEITESHFETYRKKRLRQKSRTRENETVTPTTINREAAILKAILNRAVRWGFLGFNRINRIDMHREEPRGRILTESEINLLLAHAGETLKKVLLIGLNTGMRLGEILNLEWNQVNTQHGFLTVRKTKSSKIRTIPLNPVLEELFCEMELIKQNNYYVFENPQTKEALTTVRSAWYRLIEKTGIRNVRLHDMRSTFATYALINGGDLKSLQEVLGHADLTTTAKYLQAKMHTKRALVNGFVAGQKKGDVIDFPVNKAQ